VALTLCGIAVLWVERDWKNLRQAFVAAPMLAVMALGIPAWNWQALTCGANVNFGHGIRIANAAGAPVALAASPADFTTKLIFFHEHSYGGVTTIIENRDAGQPPRRRAQSHRRGLRRAAAQGRHDRPAGAES